MPAIKGVFTAHPDTAVDGLWIVLSDGTIIGSSRLSWALLVPLSGTNENKRAAAETALNTQTQTACESSRALTFLPPTGIPEFG